MPYVTLQGQDDVTYVKICHIHPKIYVETIFALWIFKTDTGETPGSKVRTVTMHPPGVKEVDVIVGNNNIIIPDVCSGSV